MITRFPDYSYKSDDRYLHHTDEPEFTQCQDSNSDLVVVK